MNPLVIVAHGTRDAAGAEVVGRLAAAVARQLPGVAVRPAFVDVRPPRVVTALTEVLGSGALGALGEPGTVGEPGVAGEPGVLGEPGFLGEPGVAPAVVVPAFLGAGYHVRHDLPRQLADAGLADRTVLTPLLGSDPLLVAAAEDRLRRAGWRAGDAVLLAAAGSRDPRALLDVTSAASALGVRLGCEVRVGYLASGEPRASAAVRALRADGRRVAAVSWLLAPGLFQRRLAGSGADVVASPLGVHPAVVRAVVSRYREAVRCRTVPPRPTVSRPAVPGPQVMSPAGASLTHRRVPHP